jgi:hypothetical protein
MKPQYRPYFVRLVVVFLISFVAMVIVIEGAYLIQREDTDRAPKTVQIIVPAGTAQRVALGESVDLLPDNSTFVLGDVLEVINQDSVDHQLGPIWVPPGSMGKIVLEEVNKFSYSCSFAPSRYLGLDVKRPTTLMTRMTGLSISVPTTAAFLFIYSLALFPLQPKSKSNSLEAEI